jgi:hypothetical protein
MPGMQPKAPAGSRWPDCEKYPHLGRKNYPLFATRQELFPTTLLLDRDRRASDVSTVWTAQSRTFSAETLLIPLPRQSRDLGHRAGFHVCPLRQNPAAVPLAEACLGCTGLAELLLRREPLPPS